MSIESAGDITGVGDLAIMQPEQLTERLADNGFSDTLFAAQHERGAFFESGVLKDVREPTKHPIVERGIVVTDVVAKVFFKFLATPIAVRLDGETFPQVVIASWSALRCKGNAIELAALWAFDP